MANGTYKTGSGRSISQTLKQLGDQAQARFGAELFKEAQGIIMASQPLVPVDTGALRASSYVTQPRVEGSVIRVELGYGGPAAQINPKSGEPASGYALYVHENLEAHHPVGQAKYLEVPFLQARTGMTNRIVAGMRSSGGLDPNEQSFAAYQAFMTASMSAPGQL